MLRPKFDYSANLFFAMIQYMIIWFGYYLTKFKSYCERSVFSEYWPIQPNYAKKGFTSGEAIYVFENIANISGTMVYFLIYSLISAALILYYSEFRSKQAQRVERVSILFFIGALIIWLLNKPLISENGRFVMYWYNYNSGLFINLWIFCLHNFLFVYALTFSAMSFAMLLIREIKEGRYKDN